MSDFKAGNKYVACFFLLSAILGLLIAGCGETKKYKKSGKSYVIKGQRYHILASSKGYSERGVASWYGKGFHGKKTSNGEIYNMYEMTAAHKTLPHDTWVKVTNLNNSRDITVRINDRGPFVKGRIIDLSYVAARKLGMVGAGTAPVMVRALGKAEKREVKGEVRTVLIQPSSYTEGRFTVQVASFKDKGNAKALAKRLSKDFAPVSIIAFDRGDGIFYRVQVADKNTLGDALTVQSRLEKQGFKDCYVVAR